MRVILNLEEKILNGYQELAEKNKRSRKNIMELTLENALNGNNPITERAEPKVQIQDLTKPTNEVKAAEPPPATNYFVNTVPAATQPPKTVYVPLQQQYEAEILGTTHMGELKPIINRVKKDHRLGTRQQRELDAFIAAHIANKGMYND